MLPSIRHWNFKQEFKWQFGWHIKHRKCQIRLCSRLKWFLLKRVSRVRPHVTQKRFSAFSAYLPACVCVCTKTRTHLQLKIYGTGENMIILIFSASSFELNFENVYFIILLFSVVVVTRGLDRSMVRRLVLRDTDRPLPAGGNLFKCLLGWKCFVDERSSSKH